MSAFDVEMSDYANNGRSNGCNIPRFSKTLVTVSCNILVWKLRKSRLDEQIAKWVENSG